MTPEDDADPPALGGAAASDGDAPSGDEPDDAPPPDRDAPSEDVPDDAPPPDGDAPLASPPGLVASTAQLEPDVAAAVRRTMRLSLVEGGLSQTFLNWTSGSVLIGYMLHVGARPAEIALVGSLPLLAQIASPAAAYLAASLGHRKLLTVALGLASRSLWLLAAALPALPVPSDARPAFIVGLVLVASFFLAGNGTVWAAWMGDVVPERMRGRYFGFRTGLNGVLGMLANLAGGAWLDRVAAPMSFQVVLLVAVGSGLAGVWIYTRQYDPPVPAQLMRVRAMLSLPLREPGFRRFLLFAAYWTFVVFLAAPFVFPYFLDELQLSFTQVAIWSSIAATTALGTSLLWGRVADRAGNKSVLAIGTFIAGLALPGNWILAGVYDNVAFIWASAVFDAIAWGAIGPALFNLALASAPQTNRVVYIAMQSFVAGIAGFLGGVLSAPLLLAFRGLEGTIAGVPVSAYYWLFALSGLLRASAWLLIRRVPEADAWRTRDLLRSMRTGWKGLGFPWRS